ncbi:MAG: uridine phosphorylase [Rhizobiaceae bacterium]
MKTAWYLGLAANEIGDRAILIGDPDRVDRIAALLADPVFHPVSRGLRSVTGSHGGKRITVSAFGMGAPIATIVLHELADLGVRHFLRIGTAMYFPPAAGGEFLISDTAVGYDGTSPAYVTDGGPFAADKELVAALEQAAAAAGWKARTGRYATFDAFYRDMFGIDEEGAARATQNRTMLASQEVMAVDMETSALLAAARALGVACATLCLGTVDALKQEKLAPDALAKGEALLFDIALAGLTAVG